MKTSMLPLGLLSLWLGGTQCLAAVVQGEPTITERGPHHRVWSRQDVRTLQDGRAVTNVSSFVELGSGIHRWDAQVGQYVDASDLIEIAADGSGAFGSHAAYQVHFSPNANTAGAITLITPDGKTLKSHALSLAWFDSATGRSELFASIKDSIGELHAPNVVIYPDAFDGGPGFRADIRYTYRLDGFSQDIVIVTRPPDLPPGYAPDTTRMEVWTEFIEAPGATLTQQPRLGMTDDTLDFGAMQTGAGRTFVLGDEPNPKRSAPVAKRWLIAEGRTFLVEAVRYLSVKPELDGLPAPQGQAALKPRNANAQLAANVVGDRAFPPAPKARAKNQAEKFRTAAIGSPRPTDGRGVGSEGGATKSATNAAVAPLSPLKGERAAARGNSQLSTVKTLKPPPGLVIDYDLQASLTNFTLQCDLTYVVSNAVNFYGTTVFEGGCVVKFAPTNIAQLNLNGTVEWATAQYRPAIFTAVDDHTVGTTIGSGSLSGRYGGAYLYADGGTFQHLRISYARSGIKTIDGDFTIRHAQFIHCDKALEKVGGRLSANALLENVLFHDTLTLRDGQSILTGWHVTVNGADYFALGGGSLVLYNSIFADLEGWGDVTPSLVNSYVGSSSGLFQTVGAAAHYLAAGSTNRNAGTTSGMSSTLLAALKKRTTFPPIVLTGTLTNDLNLNPQAQRDTDTPDLGYHYDPLDFVCNTFASNGKTVTAMTGTALGFYASNGGFGLRISQGSQILSTGSPTNLNRFVRHNTVQEQANTNWTGFGDSILVATSSGSGTALLNTRFSEWVIPGQVDPFHLDGNLDATLQFTDSQFHGGRIVITNPTPSVTNCLFDRTVLYLLDNSGGSQLNVNVRNSTFRGESLTYQHLAADTWTFRDNSFDGIVLVTNGTLSANWNAYTTNLTRLHPPGSNDVLLATNAIAYQTGSLGFFYLPDTGPGTNLFNKGSTNANLLGLWHFTTRTNQVKETNTVVDIGFHYVATGTNGLAFDSDGDGLPDFFEDKNGNGVKDTGETGWLSLSTDADTDGDGVSDFVEYLLGRNPLVAGTTNDFNGTLNLRLYTPLK